jgi:hypothetical protein
VYGPAVKLAGLTLLSVGAGFSNVTLLLPLAFASAAAVPRIVIELGLGSVAGAVYFPLASIVPTEALPPTVPFTDHCTAWFVLPETIAVKVCEDPVRRLAVPGTTLTEIAATGGEDAAVDDVTAQPEVNLKSRNTPRQRDSLRKFPPIVEVVAEAAGSMMPDLNISAHWAKVQIKYKLGTGPRAASD